MVDVAALAAEEAARYDIEAEGEGVVARGDPRLLRRMIATCWRTPGGMPQRPSA